MNSSELTKLCGSFFNNPINNFKEDGFLPKAVGTAKILAYITLVIPLGVGLIYGASQGYDSWKNRSIQQNAPNLAEIDSRVQDSAESTLLAQYQAALSNLNFSIINSKLHSLEQDWDEKIKSIINEKSEEIDVLSSNQKFLLKSLPDINEDLIDLLVNKIYDKGQQKEFINNAKDLIDGWTSKIKSTKLTIEEEQSLYSLQHKIVKVIQSIENQENILLNQKIEEKLVHLGTEFSNESLMFKTLPNMYSRLAELALNPNSKDDDIKKALNAHFNHFIKPGLNHPPTEAEANKVKENLFQIFLDLKMNNDFGPIEQTNELRKAGQNLRVEINRKFS